MTKQISSLRIGLDTNKSLWKSSLRQFCLSKTDRGLKLSRNLWTLDRKRPFFTSVVYDLSEPARRPDRWDAHRFFVQLFFQEVHLSTQWLIVDWYLSSGRSCKAARMSRVLTARPVPEHHTPELVWTDTCCARRTNLYTLFASLRNCDEACVTSR